MKTDETPDELILQVHKYESYTPRIHTNCSEHWFLWQKWREENTTIV